MNRLTTGNLDNEAQISSGQASNDHFIRKLTEWSTAVKSLDKAEH
jgi:hypothetical protein